MRIVLISILLLFSYNVPAALPVAADDYINDYAGLISGDVEYELRDRLRSVEYYAGVEIVLVTIHSFDKYRESFDTWESFATALFNNWGIGNLPANDGVLLLVAKEGRKIRIELEKAIQNILIQ